MLLNPKPIDDYLFRGGPDTEKEDIQLAEKFGVGEVVRAAWANAKEIEEAWVDHAAQSPPGAEERKPSSFLPVVQPPVEAVVEKPIEVVEPKPSPNPNLGQAKPKPVETGGSVSTEGRWINVVG